MTGQNYEALGNFSFYAYSWKINLKRYVINRDVNYTNVYGQI